MHRTTKPARVAIAKPRLEDRNSDGTPKHETYEDYTEAVIEWKVRQILDSPTQTAAITQEISKKPALSDKNDDGSQLYEHYEAWQDALLEWKVREVLGRLFTSEGWAIQ